MAAAGPDPEQGPAPDPGPDPDLGPDPEPGPDPARRWDRGPGLAHGARGAAAGADPWPALPPTGAPVAPIRVPAPLFLHRDTYRHRRLMDAARLLPAFGTALLLLPLLWAEDHATASGAVYLFLAWLGLIVAAALLSRQLSAPLRGRDRPPGGPRDGPDSEGG